MSAIENLRQEIAEAARSVIEEVEYACFNDPEVWEPLFTAGELDTSQRFQLDDPLMTTLSLRAAIGFADLHNLERAEQNKAGKYGYIQVRVRTVTRTPWASVGLDEIAATRR